MGEALRRRIKQDRFESPVQEALLGLLVAAGHVREMSERVCSAHGVTGAQYNVLRILRGAHPDGYPRCDIAERMLDRAPDVTRLIDRLESMGFVDRAKSEKDKRLSISRITHAGLKLLARMDPEMKSVSEQFGKRVSPSDRKELLRICEGLFEDGA